MHEPRKEVFYLRVEPSVKQKFREVAARYPGDPSAVLRWLIVAFCEGRVTVAPNPTIPKE